MTSGSILIIDDEKEMRNSLKLLLEYAGFSATTSDSIKSGLAQLSENYFEIVITDYYLEDGVGTEILKYCREYCPKTRVIVMTGHASLENAVEALRHGAFDYVIKPFDFDLLYHSLQRALEHLSMMDEIALAKERYRALIEDMNEGYLIVKDGIIKYANPKMAHILNCNLKDMLNRHILEFVDFTYQESLQNKIEILSKNPGAFFVEELVLRDCKGNTVPVELRLANTLGEAIENGVILICRDITERDILWNRLVRAERLATIGEMIASIAHELNNKLTPIIGYSEILSADIPKEQLIKAIKSIKTASLGAKKIVNSLLLFSRREKPAKIKCNINDIIDNACNLVTACLGGTNIKIQKTLCKNCPPILADPHQIEQVITNILKNAIDAVCTKNGKIDIETSFESEYVEIKITDNGPGISEDIIKNIFDPFFTTKPQKDGTGLGLSICHGIIKEHGGDIVVTSHPGQTSFLIKLPVQESNTQEELPNCNDKLFQAGFPKKPTILVVEDELAVAELLLEVFSKNFNAIKANNGIEALKKLKSQEVDLIISDLRMPELNGIELYEKLLKEFPDYKNKIIFTTGLVSDSETLNFLKKYNLPYLKKPFKVKELYSTVNAILQEEMRNVA